MPGTWRHVHREGLLIWHACLQGLAPGAAPPPMARTSAADQPESASGGATSPAEPARALLEGQAQAIDSTGGGGSGGGAAADDPAAARAAERVRVAAKQQHSQVWLPAEGF